MKFFAYNVRPDEAPYFEKWQAEHDIEVTLTSDFLTADTVIRAADYNGISALQTIPYDAALFAKMERLNLPYLALRNVGIDNVDLVAAETHGVKLSNVPAYSPYAIAEFGVLQAMNLRRRTKAIANQQLHGEFHWSPDFMGTEMRHQTVGVVGVGKIGRQAIALYTGLGATVIAFDPSRQGSDAGITYVSNLETLLKQADIVTLHAPGRPENDHLLNAEAFALMKPTTIVINTARGSLVDLNALKRALDTHQIAGAALDAFEDETAEMQQINSHAPFSEPLLADLAKRDNVLLSPHMAFHTETAVTNMVNESLMSLMDFNQENQAEFELRY